MARCGFCELRRRRKLRFITGQMAINVLSLTGFAFIPHQIPLFMFTRVSRRATHLNISRLSHTFRTGNILRVRQEPAASVTVSLWIISSVASSHRHVTPRAAVTHARICARERARAEHAAAAAAGRSSRAAFRSPMPRSPRSRHNSKIGRRARAGT